MPLKSGRMTPAELKFADAYARTGDTGYAAREAGFKGTSGGTLALRRPAVRAELERLFMEELRGEILPLCLKRHKEILRDPASTGPLLTKAIELGYKYGLAAKDDAFDKDLHELSSAELNALILRLEAQSRQNAEELKLIEGELVQEPEDEPSIPSKGMFD